jgi:hypothetical protein
MSPQKVSDEQKRMLWQAMLSLISPHDTPGLDTYKDVAKEAWEYVEAHEAFIAAKNRAAAQLPTEDEG